MPALELGHPAPDFTLPGVTVVGGAAQHRHFSLRDMRGAPVVLAFYPADNSPGCTAQLCSYQSELAGFEALLRGRSAHVHGMPFFAGWGLTVDHAAPPARRGRPLALDALVAATLVLYPRYLDPETRRPIEIEGLLDRFEAGWTDPLIGRPRWHRIAAALKRRLGPLRQRL